MEGGLKAVDGGNIDAAKAAFVVSVAEGKTPSSSMSTK